MVKQNGGGDDYSDAKDLLDKIGQQVHKKVHGDTLQPSNGKLEGKLSLAIFEKNESDRETPNDPCLLDHRYHTNVTVGYDNDNPCKKRSDVRFSYTEGAECNKNKISGSNDKEGACAPYRRLHLCDQHLEKINRYDKVDNNTLLAEVCLAAKFEAESLKNYRAQYQDKYKDTGSPICTVLARSFADIGDIIRGKDLFLGNNKEKKKLQTNLKNIFEKIHDKLDNSIKSKYNDDPNYYKLRNAWWEANRQEVWKAIICGAAGGTYFRKTCGTGTWTNEKCRCPINDVPTYFDYVPQYLRWFEEWAEDFCRKKKKFLDIVKTNCRGPNGKDKYCSGDGFDCTKTVRAKGIYAIGDDCHKCSFWCGFYKKWLANQKQEFLKQKKKYKSEIKKYENGAPRSSGSGNRRLRRAATTTNYDGYESKFYDIFKTKGGVDKFLDLLSKEDVCANFSKDEGKIDFTKANDKPNEDEGTFYRSKYCEECPECGVEKETFKEKPKNDGECEGKELYNIPNNANFKEINVLSFGDERDQIKSKMEKFCAGSKEEKEKLKEQWKCYKEDDIKKHVENDYKDDVNGSGGICILEKTNGDKSGNKQKTFNDFFNFWVRHLLNDSIEWREGLKKCLQNDKKTCIRKCNDNCKCYKNWVQQKKTEWNAIKEHFDTQDFGDGALLGAFSPYRTLELVLEEYYFPLIQEAYGDAQAIEGINKTLDKKKQEVRVLGASNEETIIDYLLDHEDKDANTCVNNNPKDKCENTARGPGGARSGTPAKPPGGPPGPNHETTVDPEEEPDSEDSEEEEEEEENDGEQDTEAEASTTQTTQQEEGEQPVVPSASQEPAVTPPGVKPPCEIVDKLFTTTETLKQACSTKYVNGREKFPNWKCISDTTTSGGSGKPTGSSGSICVPPRRRKLYLHDLKTLDEKPTDTQLLEWFVESAAIETFFLWHRYKKQKEKKPQSESQLLGTGGTFENSDDPENPQKKLEGGDIPNDFLRQMFYTLGDYRDICVGKTPDGIDKVSASGDNKSGDTKIKDISEKIKSVIENSGSKPPRTQTVTPTSDEQREKWWDDNAKHIWNGMICALTHKTDNPKVVDDKVKGQLFESGNPITKYQYGKVELEEDNTSSAMSTGPKPIIASSSSDENTPTTLNNPKLTQFVERPPYFRYLEEWGDTFCRQRTRMLKNVKDNCRNSEQEGKRHCSGDGHDCTKNGQLKHNDMSADLNCPSCYVQCRKYRKWIDMKFEEFHKQNDKYKGEHDKLNGNSNNEVYQKFYEQIKEKKTAAKFLEALKHCKNSEGGEDKNNDNKIDFGKPLETFRHSKYCDTCPLKGVTCGGRNGCTPVNGNGNTWKEVFGTISGNGGNSTTIDVKMIDHRGPFIKNYSGISGNLENSQELNASFKKSYLFKGVRNQKWECRFKEEKTDICELKNFNNDIDLNQYTTFKVLIVYWLEDFLYGYYILKKKRIIDLCTKSVGKTCDEKYQKNCVCVKVWVEKKKNEWKEIKKHFKNRNQKDGDGNDMKSSVKKVLEDLQSLTELNKIMQPCTTLDKFKASLKCNSTESLKKGEGGEKDIIECLLKKLEQKAKNCKDQASGEEKHCGENPPPDDEEDLLLEEGENAINSAPEICKDVIKTQQDEEKEEGGCEAAAPPPKERAPTAPKKQKDACKIVEEIYGTSNNGQNGINRCFPKKGPFVWKCGDKSLVKDEGVCMPPRRKSLCIYILTLQQQTKDEDKLREAFIKCAAAETCLLWHKYKKEKEKKKSYVIGQIAFDEEEEDPQSQLERGQIPDEFKRQMFYTFGDYRDLCLDKDISKKQGPVEDATNNIRNFFSGKNGKSPSGKTPDEGRKAWWDGIKEDVWKGMLCALEKIVKNPSKFTNNSKYSYTTVTFSGDNSPTLEKFAQTPQFLRWFTEWSDDFCIQQKKELKTLENKCNFSTCDDANDNEKKKCHQACWNYKAFLKKWKKQYKKQNIEFEGLRYTDSIIKDKSAPEYLEENCKDKCSCIKEADYTHYNKSFEYPPQNFKDKCNCPLFDKNETDDTNKKSKPKKEDDTYEDFEKCPFENSGNRDGTTVIKNDRCKNLNVNRQCTETKYENDLDQWTGKLVRDSSKDNEGVLMPPRRVHLCTRTITKNKYRTTETDKFKKDLFDSAYNQGFLLGKKFKDYNDEGHEALKNSFADYGDIIRGKDIMETTTPTDIKEKLEKLLKNAEKTAQSNGTTPQPKSVNQWWEQYRTSVWHAMLCGYHQGINGPQTLGRRRGRQSQPVTALTSSPTTKTIPPNWCQLPTDDSTDQFLRWLREWGTQYCKEKQQLKSNMQMPCKSHLDKYGIIEKKNDINPNCLPSLDKYEVWSNNRLPEWDGLSKKFTKDKEKDKYNNVKETSAENYLKQNCSECKCSFKDIEQTHEKSIKGGHDIFVDILDKAQIPGFVEDIAYRYKGINPKCPEDNECNQYQNIACRGLPHDDDTDWKLSFVNDTKTTNKGVLVPPRRRQLCLRVEPNKLRQLKRNVEKFKNFICSSALAETKRLKQVYKDDNNKLLQAIKYSFADIGNVVKGDDMMESPTSKYIGELFNSTKYNAIDRKNWWNENKYHVWESMLCAYRQAAEDTEKNEKCRFPDIESVPQFLRWFQEWTKIFCIKRKTLYDKMVTECQKAECDKNTGNVQGSDCIKACKKYKYYVLKKKIEYEIQSNKYNKEFKTILNNKDASEFLKVECLSLFFSEAPEKNWGDPYETLEETLKNKCTCIKTESKCPKDIYKVDDEKTKQDIVKPTTPSNKTYADEASPKKTEVLPPQPSDNTSDILEKTIPFGIALALGSIAFLFMKVIYIYICAVYVCMLCVYVKYIYIIYVFLFKKKKRNKGKYLLKKK